MTNANLKKAVRERMARTGEKYTTALRAVQREHEEKRASRQDVPAGGSPMPTGEDA